MLQELTSIIEQDALIEGRYRATKVLGSGASGAVLLAEDTRLDDTHIALKVLLPHLLRNEESIARFRNETRITMSLAHPSIVQTYGLGRHNEDFTYLKMEYCEGSPLREYIERYPRGMPLETVHRLALDIASALSFAHSQGVIHRDLKPENILVTPEGRARLLDFGLAQSVRFDAQATAEGAILGTPYYMSPEQILSEFTDDGVDIYSFGILLYEMITGERPFEGSTFWQLAQCHLEDEVPDITREDVPLWLKELLVACSAKQRAKRPNSIEEVFACLHENASDEVKQEVQVTTSKHQTRVESVAEQKNAVLFLSMLSKSGWSLFWFAVVSSFFVVPHFNASALWRYATCALFVEHVFGTKIPAMRQAFGIPVDVGYPDSFFGPEKTLAQKKSWKAEPNNSDYRVYFRPLVYFGYDPNYYDPVMKTYPLHYAFFHGQTRAIWDLLNSGADPRLPDGSGFRAMDYAVLSDARSAPVFRKLLEAGANPNLSPPDTSPPTISLINRGEDGILRVVLEHPNSDPNVCDEYGVPALFNALRAARPMTMQLLLDNGADINIVDSAGRGIREYAKTLPYMAERESLLRLVEKHGEKSDGVPIRCKEYPPPKVPA